MEIKNVRAVLPTGKVVDIEGLSTENKPLDGIGEESRFTETDTGTVYQFTAEGNKWIEAAVSGGGGATLPLFIPTEYNYITLYKDEDSGKPMWAAVDENNNMLSFEELCNRAVLLPCYTPGAFGALQFIGSNSSQLEMFTPAKMKFDGTVFKLTTTKLILMSDGTMKAQQVSGTLNS